MSAAAATSPNGSSGGLLGFLRQARAALLAAHKQQEEEEGTPRQQLKVVIGNEAADADSVVSAITLAYFLSAQHPSVQYVPVLSLPRAEMKLRPETLLLLRLAGAAEEEPPAGQRHLTFLDEADLPALAQKCPELKVVLVDHNRLCRALQPALDGRVEAIVDHHEDKGHYPWVQEAHREVAFEGGFNGGGSTGASLSAAPSLAGGLGGLDGSLGGSLSLTRSSSAVGKALVASTCTLVAERFLARAPHLLQSPSGSGDGGGGGGNVAALLLGVIMLDAAGLDPMAGKVTERDLAAVAALERAVAAGGSGGGGGGGGRVGVVGEKMALYKRLSGAKFDRE